MKRCINFETKTAAAHFEFSKVKKFEIEKLIKNLLKSCSRDESLRLNKNIWKERLFKSLIKPLELFVFLLMDSRRQNVKF